MTTKKFVRYTITANLYEEDPMEEWGESEEEVREIIEEDSRDILMEGWADWDVDVEFVEREVEE